MNCAGRCGRRLPPDRASSARADRPDAIEQLTGYIVRASFHSRRTDPGIASRKGQRRGLSRRHSAERHARGRDRNQRRDRRRRLRRSRRSCRRDPRRAATAKPKSATASRPIPAKPSSTNVRVLAIDQTVEDKNGQKVVIGKTATLELSAAPGRSRSRSASRSARCRSHCAASSIPARTPRTVRTTSKRSGINMVRFGITTNAIEK